MNNCVCGSGKFFEDCCGPLLRGLKEASTAKALMRSRYTAFVKADVEYLMKSCHSSTRDLSQKKEIKTWTTSVTWLCLKISNTNKGTAQDKEGTVAFKASFMEEGQVKVISENSYFVRENGNWRYLKECKSNQ
jgi:SEC-C motif-containing protein